MRQSISPLPNIAFRPWTGGYLFDDEFTTDTSAPLTSPRNAEPGSGVATLVQNDGQFSISSSKLQLPGQASSAWNDLTYIDSSTLARKIGRVLKTSINLSTLGDVTVGWLNSTAPGATNNAWDAGFRLKNPLLSYQRTVEVRLLQQISTGVEYQIAVVLRSIGAYVFLKADSGNWKLVWIDDSLANANLRLGLANFSGVGAVDFVRVKDLVTPFDTDLGLAAFNITSFTQSVGASVLTNGALTAWTGDNPDSWTVSGESGANPEVTQRNPNQGHADSMTTGGAANFFSSATNNQPRIAQTALTVGTIYRIGLNVTNRVSGNLAVLSGGVPSQNNYASTGNRRPIMRATATSFQIGGGTAPNDITADDLLAEPITLNAQQVAFADGIFQVEFTLPPSPSALDEIALIYRMPAAGDEFLNCWAAKYRRNDSNGGWDFRLDRYSSGTRTNVFTSSSVSALGDAIRVITEGNDHICYIRVLGIWTQVGTGIQTNATHNTGTRVNTVYSPNFTVSRLIGWKVTDSTNYDTQLDAA